MLYLSVLAGIIIFSIHPKQYVLETLSRGVLPSSLGHVPAVPFTFIQRSFRPPSRSKRFRRANKLYFTAVASINCACFRTASFNILIACM